MSQSEIISPWEIDLQAVKWQWAIQYTRNKGVPSLVWKPPLDPRTDDQIKKLYTWCTSARNWLVCYSTSPSYLRMLYFYLEAMWACNTGNTYEELEVKDIPKVSYERDEEKEEIVRNCGLLVLPYGEVAHPSVAKAGGVLASSILIKRKLTHKPLITDIFVTRRVGEEDYPKEVKRLMDIYGNLALDLFVGDHVKNVYVSVPGKEIDNV